MVLTQNPATCNNQAEESRTARLGLSGPDPCPMDALVNQRLKGCRSISVIQPFNFRSAAKCAFLCLETMKKRAVILGGCTGAQTSLDVNLAVLPSASPLKALDSSV